MLVPRSFACTSGASAGIALCSVLIRGVWRVVFLNFICPIAPLSMSRMIVRLALASFVFLGCMPVHAQLENSLSSESFSEAEVVVDADGSVSAEAVQIEAGSQQ